MRQEVLPGGASRFLTLPHRRKQATLEEIIWGILRFLSPSPWPSPRWGRERAVFAISHPGVRVPLRNTECTRLPGEEVLCVSHF